MKRFVHRGALRKGIPMAIFAIVGTLVGAVFGLRFNMFILVPVMGFAWTAVVADGVARGNSGWQLAAALALVAASLQLGYLAGSVLRFVMVPRDTDHRRSVPTSSRMSGSIR